MTASDTTLPRKYWLMKTEPSECSFESVYNNPNHTVDWFGIRNYQARNFMRDEMKPGDGVLFYHSSCPMPGIVGIAQIASEAYPDRLQFDPSSEYFDAKSTAENPRWLAVDVEALRPTPLITLSDLRSHPETADMRVLARGNRLSITPVTEAQFRFVCDVLARRG